MTSLSLNRTQPCLFDAWLLGPGLALWLLIGIGVTHADEFQMYVGSMKTLTPGKVTRVAVGNGKLLSTSVLDNGKLLVLAEKEGDTLMQIWLESGQMIEHKFFITAADSSRTTSEATLALSNLPGVKTRQVGPNILVEGRVNTQTTELIEKVASKYPDIINCYVTCDYLPKRSYALFEARDILKCLFGKQQNLTPKV